MLETHAAEEHLSVQKIRRDFPILQRTIHGKRLVYLDNAATSQKPRQVIQSLTDYYDQHNANIHRSVHLLAEEATQAFEATREKTRSFVNAKSTDQIVFTRGTTESINIVAYCAVPLLVRKGDSIVVTELEHHSNFVPWQQAAIRAGAKFEIVRVDDEGFLDERDLEEKLTNAKILAFSQSSNVLGTNLDAKKLVRMAHDHGAIAVVDGAQSVPHMPVDVQDLDCDIMAWSSHKMLGPTGVGCLFGKLELLEKMPPFLFGGDMIKEVERDYSTWNDLPWKFEAGTSNIADVIAYGAALEYLKKLGMSNVRQHEKAICRRFFEDLRAFPDMIVYGPSDPEKRSASLSFNIGNIHAHDVASILDEDGVAIRSGHHCAQVLMRRLGVTATARASFYIYNDVDDIESLTEGIKKVRKVFG
jgi:cysteine desulfurase / selenocysteine lyase